MPTTILDHRGNPIDFSESAATTDITAEFATRARAGEFSSFLSWLPDPDPVLLKRGDGSDVLQDLTADDQVCMAMQARKLRVLNEQQYGYSPGQAKGRDVAPDAARLCDALAEDLESINLRDVFNSILDAPFFGFTVLELIWRPENGRYRLGDIIAKPREWFAFDDHNRPVFRGAAYATSEPLPQHKFVLVRHFPTFENPYGLRLLSRCLWPVAFKRGGIEFLSRFLEKFGMPWVLAKAPRNATRPERIAMAGDLASMVQDAVAVLPNGAEVDVAANSSKGSGHEDYLRRWDKAISKVLMGQTLTAEMDGSGSRAASETHYSVSGDMADADQFMVAATMNDIAVTYRNVNAGAGVMAPVFAYDEPDDYASQADLDIKLHGIGVRFKKVHFSRCYGMSDEEFDLDGEASGGDSEGIGPEFAEGEIPDSAQADIDRALAAVKADAVAANDQLVQAIQDAVEKAETPEDAMLLLAELLGEENETSELEELLAQIHVAAAMRGTVAVREEED